MHGARRRSTHSTTGWLRRGGGAIGQIQTNGYMYKFPSPLHSFLRHSFKAPTCLTILQGITICPTYRPPALRRGPSKNSSEFTSKRLSSWSVPTKVPRKTRLSLVTTRRVWLSNALTAVIAGELKADELVEVDIGKARVSVVEADRENSCS